MSNYWEERTRANAAKAEKEAAQYARKLNSTLHHAVEEIDRYISDLLLSGETPTRSQLWRAGRYLQLRQAIEQQCQDIGQRQITLLDELLPQLYDEILGVNLKDFKAAKTPFAFVPNRLIKQSLDTAWSGQSYSSRIWTNTNALAAKLEQDITDYIVLGKSRTQITNQIKEDFKVSWNKADRLFRTESAHVATEAAKASYKQAGITQVKWIHGNGHCDCPVCTQRDGQIYALNDAPTLPAHPNCVCCLAPVVDLLLESKTNPTFYKRTKRHQQHAEDITGLRGDDAWSEYVRRAQDLLKAPIDDKIISGFVSPDGWLFKYNHQKNEFAILSDKGTISTYFIPERGEKYWIEQNKLYNRRRDK